MKELFVTKPALPPLSDFFESLKTIWDKKLLTNMGNFHHEFEKALCDYLGVKYISLCASGTNALMIALKALDLQGEVITTPYSFVATSHVLSWNFIKPVFADIEPKTFNLDPARIETAVSSKTTAILPVHVYGNPCNFDEIQKVADKFHLKVIYDACHAFGVKVNSVPVLEYGNLSVLSFHATKVFNTFEGGAIVCHDLETKIKIDRLKNFGFVNESTIDGVGINGKMNEFQAALGLLQLKYIDENIQQRKIIFELYRKRLKKIRGISFLNDIPGVEHNRSYFPIFVDEKKYGKSRDALYSEFKSRDVHVRRYFYPLISQIPFYRDRKSAEPNNLPVAEKTAQQVICLPIYPGLQNDEIAHICDIIEQ